MLKNWFAAAIVLVNLVCLAYCQRRAVCVLTPTVWAPYVQGTLFLDTQQDGSGATISGTITGAPPNRVFGFHIHDFGHIGTPDGAGAGGHYNPFGSAHALPPITPRHIGDMGNVTSDQYGTISVSKQGEDVLWTLNGTTSALGRGLILHSRADDGTGPTGNAGNRLAQCVIGVRSNTPNHAMADEYQGTWATAEVRGVFPNTANIVGRVTFTVVAGNKVRVQAKVCGFGPFSQHGFHVHEFGDLSGNPGDVNLGSHFNPLGSPHGWQDNPVRHLGDMGNVTADANGVVHADLTLDLLTLTGNNSILGRAVVIHSNPDNGGQPTGNSGTRYSAGIIGAVGSSLAFDDLICNASRIATCALEPTAGNNVTGVLTFAVDDFGVPKLSGSIHGLVPNSVHGIHVHEFGHLTRDGLGVGAHFNPLNVTHGLPGTGLPRHIGDLGNHTADANGVISLNLVGSFWHLWRLEGMLSVLGRGLIVHAGTDNGSDPAGSSGARYAQCVLGVARAASLAMNQAVNDNPGTQFATCEIRVGKSSYGNITGRVVFSVSGGGLNVKAKICGLPKNTNHGFHVHEFGDLSDITDLTANTGGHFNPFGAPHALPATLPRHLGDMGNLVVNANGVATYDADVNTLALAGNNSIIGRAVIIHNNPDDGSQPTGGAGTKLAVCVVGVVDRLLDLADINCPPLPAPTPVPSKKSAAVSNYISLLTVFASFLAMLLMM